MLGRKCGHDKKKASYAAPMQGPPVPEQPKKPVREPAGEAKGYEEIRARIGKGKKWDGQRRTTRCPETVA